jgi:hypothetical protein
LGRGTGEAPPFPTSSLPASKVIGVTTTPESQRKVLKPGFRRNRAALPAAIEQRAKKRRMPCGDSGCRYATSASPRKPWKTRGKNRLPHLNRNLRSKRFQSVSPFRLPNVATMYIICRLARQCPFAYIPVLLHLCRPHSVFRMPWPSLRSLCARVPAPQHRNKLQFRSQMSVLKRNTASSHTRLRVRIE